jgi:hypothetical protein
MITIKSAWGRDLYTTAYPRVVHASEFLLEKGTYHSFRRSASESREPSPLRGARRYHRHQALEARALVLLLPCWGKRDEVGTRTESAKGQVTSISQRSVSYIYAKFIFMCPSCGPSSVGLRCQLETDGRWFDLWLEQLRKAFLLYGRKILRRYYEKFRRKQLPRNSQFRAHMA